MKRVKKPAYAASNRVENEIEAFRPCRRQTADGRLRHTAENGGGKHHAVVRRAFHQSLFHPCAEG